MKWAAFTLTIALLITLNAKADVEVNLKQFSDTSGDEYFKFGSWRGIEVKYQEDPESLFYFISYDTASVSLAFDINFLGMGAGFKNPLTSSTNIYGQLGYYFVETSLEGRFDCPLPCGEGLHYLLNRKWEPLHNRGLLKFEEYEIESEGGLGITFGIETTHKLTKDTSLVFGLEFRALDFTLGVHGMAPEQNYNKTGARWETQFKSASSTAFKVSYLF